MPNHCVNELIFRGVDQEAQERILERTCGEDGKVDFEILVPTPLNLWMGSVSASHEKAFKRTALDWNRENWGTKWNAYDPQSTEQTADTLILRFETAWSPPYPWLAAVLNSLSLPFEHNWMEEGGGTACGTFKTEGQFGGPEWSEHDPDPEMFRHLHKLLWGVEEFTA